MAPTAAPKLARAAPITEVPDVPVAVWVPVCVAVRVPVRVPVRVAEPVDLRVDVLFTTFGGVGFSCGLGGAGLGGAGLGGFCFGFGFDAAALAAAASAARISAAVAGRERAPASCINESWSITTVIC